MKYFGVVFLTTLIIFNNIIAFVNCKLLFDGGDGYKSLVIGNKIYYLSSGGIIFFYVDLDGISLDSDEKVDPTKWNDLTEIKPKPDDDISNNPMVGGKDGDQ